MTRSSALALAAIGVIAVLGGCGGGGDATALATSSLSGAEFAKRAEAICSQGRREALRYQPAGKGESERDALTKAIEVTLLPSIDRAVDKLYALGAPAERKQQVEALLTAMREAIEKAEGLEPPSLERIEGLLARSSELARRAGLVSCVYG